MSAPALDVVVVSHQSRDHLRQALELVPPQAHVVVVDNASDDGSAELAAELGADVVRNDTNAGFGAAANQGAARGHAELVLFLNPDARLSADDLQLLVERIRADEDLAVVGPRLVRTAGGRQRARWPFPSSAETWRWATGLRRVAPLGFDDGGADGGFIVGACMLVRRTAFEAVGGFDAAYWLYAEEADLCWRLREAGWDVQLVEEAQARHAGGASGEGVASLVQEHFDRGTERFVLQREGRRGLISHRIAMLLGTALRGVTDEEQRQRVRSTARRLVRSPLGVPQDSPATEDGASCLVVCSLEAWDETLRRNQLLVSELVAHDPHLRVLFVEPPYDPVHALRSKTAEPRRQGVRSAGGDGRIRVFQPIKPLPRRFGGVSVRSMCRQVRRAAAVSGFSEPTLWVNDATYAPLVETTRWPSLYDITDDWLESTTTDRARVRLEADEDRLLAGADEVVVCSPGLVASRRRSRPDVHLIPNAVDVERFVRPQPRPDDLPEGSTAVYVGSLHEDRLDVELVRRLAEQHPDLHVVLVGPDFLEEGSRRRLTSLGNLHQIGARPHATVPAYLQHAGVVIVPHVVSPFTESLDPIKAYECLAVGRPTVATPVAGFRDLHAPVVVAEGGAWVEQAARLAGRRAPSDPQPVASWATRAAQMRSVIGRARSRHEQQPLGVLRIFHAAVVQTWRGRERAMRRAGVDVELVTARSWDVGGTVVRFEGGDVQVEAARVVGRHPYRFVFGPAPIWRALRRRDVDVIDIHEEPASLVTAEVLLLRWFAGSKAPFVLYSAQNIEKRYPPPFRWIERWALRHAGGVHVCNRDAGDIVQRKGLHGEVEILGLGIESEDLDDDAARPRPSQPRTVGYVGRLERHKGVHVLLDALGPVDDVLLHIVGDGPERAQLVEQAAELGMSDRVDFVGHVPQSGLPDEYRQLDLLVVPSLPTKAWTEQFGRVVVEAMAAGTPVLASRCGELPVVVGEAGALVDPGDASALRSTIESLLEQPDVLQAMADEGLRRAADYTWDALVARHIAFYRRVTVAAS